MESNDRLVAGNEERGIQEDERHRAMTQDIFSALRERTDCAEVFVWVGCEDKILKLVRRELVPIEKLDGVISKDLNHASEAHTPDALHGNKRVYSRALLWREASRMREGSEIQVMPQDVGCTPFYDTK